MGYEALGNLVDADPERLSASAGPDLERVLLQSLRTVTVPSDAKVMAWGALSAQVAGTAAGAGFGSSAWRLALKGIAASKAVLVVPVVVVGLAVAGLHHGGSAAPSRVGMPSAAVVTVPAAPALPVAAPPDARAAEPEAPARSASLPQRDRLARESSALTRARAELRAGDAAAARATLGRMQQKFGSGALHQEREVLAIEALAAQGNAAEADRLARAFISAHPESPHKAALQRFVR